MTEQDRVNRMYRLFPERHRTFTEQPYLSRRAFFEVMGAGLTGAMLMPSLRATETVTAAIARSGVRSDGRR